MGQLPTMLRRFKGLVVSAYLKRRPDFYEVPFAGRSVRFLTDRPYTKIWYYRNRFRSALRGYHEPSLTMLLERLAGCKHALLDVGSHLGYFPVLFASVPGNRAVAVELDPSNFRELVRGVDWQPQAVRERIQTLNAGISDGPYTIDVARSRPHNSSHRIDSPQSDTTDVISVRLVAIDALLEEIAFTPDVVKIDVEGFEAHALRGAKQLLDRTHPVLLIEIHPIRMHSLGENADAIMEKTRAAGYRHFQFRDHRSLKGSALTEAVSLAGDYNRDLVCIHSGDTAGLAAIEPFLDRTG